MTVCVSVCLSVCFLFVREHIFGTTHPIFTNFFVLVTYGRGSVLVWRRSDTLCTSGFMDDVKAAQRVRLVEAQPTCSLGLGNKRRVGIPVARQWTHTHGPTFRVLEYTCSAMEFSSVRVP